MRFKLIATRNDRKYSVAAEVRNDGTGIGVIELELMDETAEDEDIQKCFMIDWNFEIDGLIDTLVAYNFKVSYKEEA